MAFTPPGAAAVAYIQGDNRSLADRHEQLAELFGLLPSEARFALALSRGQSMRLVLLPQALRVIVPPMTSQYLNITKNSSLAIAIGYPDLVAVGGTVLNQTGQAIEVVAIWMIVYLGLSLATSGFMNWFNAKMALVER